MATRANAPRTRPTGEGLRGRGSNMFRFHRSNGSFQAEPVIEIENEELDAS